MLERVKYFGFDMDYTLASKLLIHVVFLYIIDFRAILLN